MTQQEYINYLKKTIESQNKYIDSLEYYKELYPKYYELQNRLEYAEKKLHNIEYEKHHNDDRDFKGQVYDELMSKFNYKLRMQVLYDHKDEILKWIEEQD